MFTVEAVIDEKGNVKILQPVPLEGSRKALVVILNEPALPVAELALPKIGIDLRRIKHGHT